MPPRTKSTKPTRTTRKRTAAKPPVSLPLTKRSVAWRVNTEPTVILGGGRALLLQVAHPSVAAGVGHFSRYTKDPWGRLFGTLHVVMKMMFGSPEESERHQRLLDEFHQGIVGIRDDGTPYRALDPALLLWVWSTLVDTAVEMYRRCVGPLSDEDRDRYYEESKALAVGVGVPYEMCPKDWAAFQKYYRGVIDNDLRVTEPALKVAVAIMAPPFPFGLAGVASVPQRLVTTGLLPGSVREQYGLEWSPGDQWRLDAFFASVMVASRLTISPIRRLPAEFGLRLKKPLRLPVFQWLGGRVTSARVARAGFAS